MDKSELRGDVREIWEHFLRLGNHRADGTGGGGGGANEPPQFLPHEFSTGACPTPSGLEFVKTHHCAVGGGGGGGGV